MSNHEDIPPLQFKKLEPISYQSEYEMDYNVQAQNCTSYSTLDLVSARDSATSSSMVTARSTDTPKSSNYDKLDPTDIAKKLYDVFKASEELCDAAKLKFGEMEFNESCKCVIGQIASASHFVLPWNAIKLLLAISWIKILEEFDNPNKMDLEEVKVLYMSQILKFNKPFLTVQRFAEILFHQPYKQIDKFLNATVRIIFIRESNYINGPNEGLYTDDIIALVKITNKWQQMLGEKMKQMGLEVDEEIWSSSETEKSDKKEDETSLDEEKRDNNTPSDAIKRDFDEEDENIHSKRAKIQL
ncbi:hypothetical protein BMR1_03g04415 [Babesia microti strain RI]|uniref:Uncharacterized protein n=1 Tax=Babesia microti (strain RI) TaxID=1133968 RepID=A0A1R4ACE7_BABMR|nr:hypothetical protein BMR1_03g04415 [Babesia microti strain RI]SJK86676.1 hypothetical protein BMR1_03g04415 [Babesia microti strain RI]|eukprot:XP_021338805.1 hypothetical protein BMR1_03g04415 [Babesia microti strain RI]